MHICSVKARLYILFIQKGQSHKILSILAENLAKGLRYRRKRCWSYVSVFENTLEKLILKTIFPKKVAVTLLSGSRKDTV